VIIVIGPGDGPAEVVVVITSILAHRRSQATMARMPRTVITFGTFDVFHVGHLRVIERAAALGDRLVVGVSADELNLRKKGRAPVFSQAERLAIVQALKPVDEVFVEESLEQKREYIERYDADVLVMGDDWAGKFDELEDICEVVYLPRTPAISTTALIEKISSTS
jgi:glycerol-3-phosphate cytidylyltransferase